MPINLLTCGDQNVLLDQLRFGYKKSKRKKTQNIIFLDIYIKKLNTYVNICKTTNAGVSIVSNANTKVFDQPQISPCTCNNN